MNRPEPQTASAVLMIRPTAFHSNPQTAASNAFQREPDAVANELEQQAAAVQFESLADTLRMAGVEVIIEQDTVEPATPDSIFPNNWISLHADGSVVLFPMMAPNRRTERRLDIVERLGTVHGFRVQRVLDLSAWEERDRFLEGTGSMILDRVLRVAYACLSPRTDIEVLEDFCQRTGFKALPFQAVDADGVPIYHTNVMMALGKGYVVICDAAIANPDERHAVLERLRSSGREIVSISHPQMAAFAGNMLELINAEGERVLVMSRRAEASLTDPQRAVLGAHTRLLTAAIDDIEDSAGGGVRCMLAEIFLPRR
ncbi:MAG: arginine deiminase-related protein [Gammaproteobacteria bacterium]